LPGWRSNSFKDMHKGRYVDNENLQNELNIWLNEEAAKLVGKIDALMRDQFPDEPLDLKSSEEGTAGMLRISRSICITPAWLELADHTSPIRRLNILFLLSQMVSGIEVGTEQSNAALSANGRNAADARHAKNREIAERIKAWYRENCHKYGSMDDAAEAATKVESLKFRAARKHIGAAAKELRSTRKA